MSIDLQTIQDYREELQRYVDSVWGKGTIEIPPPAPDLEEKDTNKMYASVAKLINDIKKKMTSDDSYTGDRLREAFIPVLGATKRSRGIRKMQNLTSQENIAGIFAVFWPTFSLIDFGKEGRFARTCTITLQRFTIRPHIELNKLCCEKYNEALIADNKTVSETLELFLRALIIHELAHALFERDFNSARRDSPRELSIEGVLSKGEILRLSMETGESGDTVEFMLYGGRLGLDIKEDESESEPRLFLKKYYLGYEKKTGKEVIATKDFNIRYEEVKRQLQDGHGVPMEFIV